MAFGTPHVVLIYLALCVCLDKFLHGIHIWDFTLIYPRLLAVREQYGQVVLHVPLPPKVEALYGVPGIEGGGEWGAGGQSWLQDLAL